MDVWRGCGGKGSGGEVRRVCGMWGEGVEVLVVGLRWRLHVRTVGRLRVVCFPPPPHPPRLTVFGLFIPCYENLCLHTTSSS